MKELNIIICGVGGQGVVLLSELLGAAAVSSGISVKGSEVLGMAQRGGPVFSNIRLGKTALAPLTPEGMCDVIVALEPAEALRNIHFLARGGVAIINSRMIPPFTVFLGRSSYPSLEAIKAGLGKVTNLIITLDAMALAQQAGAMQAANVVMLGALYGSGLVPINVEKAKATILSRFKGKAGKFNVRAFDLGYREARKSLEALAAKDTENQRIMP
jgi:indolepyruvate ferredoxin oxidoreductase beta subunit